MSVRLDAPESELERAAIELAMGREASGQRARLRAHGVVHTPLPLVRFALRRVHRSLASELGIPDGLASERINVLDPAAGTGVWLASLLTVTADGTGPGAVLGFDSDPEALSASERLLTPKAHGIPLSLRCENTLTLADPWPRNDAVRVVLGNPPWGARSLSRGLALSDAWLREFHHDADGIPLRERRTGVLSDDYVRFFRWALEQARGAPAGAVVCFLTNSSYLDGPVHRGMRAALVHAFDTIEVTDLGGNALVSQGAMRDENLFPVRVGAALAVCTRRRGAHPRCAIVTHAKLTGARSDKLAALSGEPRSVSFQPVGPAFRFTPPGRPQSDGDFSLAELFPFSAEGVQTNRDALITAHSRAELMNKLQRVASGSLQLAPSRHLAQTNARACARQALARPELHIAQLAYRPFEVRFYCQLAPLCHRPRPRLMRAVQASSLSLLSVRKEPGAARWNMFSAARTMADSSYLSTRSACRTRMFPSHDAEGKQNLSARISEGIAQVVGHMPSAIDLMAYTLGVLGAPLYRSEHAAQMKHDYPRLPFPRDAESFAQTSEAGRMFLRVLEGAPVHPQVWLETAHDESEAVPRSALTWRSPHRIELNELAEIGAGSSHELSAQVGHHAIVESAFRGPGQATIRTVLEACQRAVMWGEAEKAADAAYQPASSVRPHAKAVAVND